MGSVWEGPREDTERQLSADLVGAALGGAAGSGREVLCGTEQNGQGGEDAVHHEARPPTHQGLNSHTTASGTP